MTAKADTSQKGPVKPPRKPSPRKMMAGLDAKIRQEIGGQRNDLTPPVAPPAGTEGAAYARLIRLTLDEVRIFEHNPRSEQNPSYLNIKESIKTVGLENRLSVTQLPGERGYVLAKGGGTRYQILRELWQESIDAGTPDRRFFEMDFELVDFVSTIHLWAAHISENRNRGKLCFWDNATSFIGLKAELEIEAGKALSVADTCSRFAALGLPSINTSALQLYRFAMDRLSSLHAARHMLTYDVVKDQLSPGYNALQRLSARFQLLRDEFDEEVWQPAAKQFTKAWEGAGRPPIDWETLVEDARKALAVRLEVAPGDIPRLLDVIRIAPDATKDDLLQSIRPASPAPAEQAPATAGAEEAPEQTEQSSPGPHEDDDDGLPTSSTQTRAPSAYAPQGSATGAPDQQDALDHDRPPQSAIDEAQETQRRRREQVASERLASTSLPVAPVSDEPMTPMVLEEGRGLAYRRNVLLALAIELASQSKSLANEIRSVPGTPLGWIIDLPGDVAFSDAALPPQAKQIWWLLARASFQHHVAFSTPDVVRHTNFGEFVRHLPFSSDEAELAWARIKPADGFEFLVSWLIDPQYSDFGSLAQQILTGTMELVANHADEFLAFNHALDFSDIQESHQADRQARETEELDYFLKHGANASLVREFFPRADLSSVSFRPGRVGNPVDLKTAQFEIYRQWDTLRTIPSERSRLITLHKRYPDITITSLYFALIGED